MPENLFRSEMTRIVSPGLMIPIVFTLLLTTSTWVAGRSVMFPQIDGA